MATPESSRRAAKADIKLTNSRGLFMACQNGHTEIAARCSLRTLT